MGFINREKMFDGIALLSGGSYGQWTTVPKTHVMKMPKNLSYQEVISGFMNRVQRYLRHG